MKKEEAINYLQPIADSASLPRYAEALNMAISALREQPRWISVEDRLPEADTDVLTLRTIGTMDVEVYHEDEVAWTWDGYSKGFVTHWMPLPEPPKEEV